ncbi:type IV secretory system conjugative DNA transfer family protein [Streptomyces abyssomicinicus]|uniref:type IV secretory system conjugative DNA transfer family protein n=1 Tax=Streptomyces abyssomicinicus TaxID=574929 RepID=UPI00124FBF98|nr:type IV secretory system conjugative DNA transfer family protein [Streptomyces abyssomicinicus]
MPPEEKRSATPGGQGRPDGQGGVPDGLLVGLLAFLLGLTLLVWTATGLAALFSHGSWPDAVTFTRSPLAIRHLVGSPRDLAGAWPDAAPEALSGYGLFWGLLIGELMVLIVLTVFVLGTVARWRAVRAARRAGLPLPGHDRPATPAAHTTPAAHAASAKADPRLPADTAPTTPAPVPPARPAHHPDHGPVPHAHHAPGGAGTAPPGAPPASGTPTPPAGSGPADHVVPAVATAHPPAPAPPAPPWPTAPVPAAHPAAAHPAPAPPQGSSAPTAPLPVAPLPAAVPTPVGPVLYAPPAERLSTAVQAVLEAEGPVLAVTSDPALWEATKDARAKLGPVLVHDASRLCDTPARLHWSPLAGCEERDTAAARATALLAPVRPAARLDAAVADTAETLLRCYLHAAAVDGRTVRHLHRWAQGNHVQEAVRALRTHPSAASGAAGELESALTAHTERRDMAHQLTSRALACLGAVHIREACTPNRNDSLVLDSFVHESGTLYVIGESVEDPRTDPAAMPLLTALASSVVERGRRMAERSSSGRLDPPITLVLDDVAAVAPVPQLPDLLSAGTALGLPTLALVRSREQLRARWPHAGL